MYRVRLIGVFLGPARMNRKPHLFTGFDPSDNIELHQLSSENPLHIINGTLNLVRGEQLAWQERKAESFTMSRLHCGSWHIGYRPSAQYGNGITLGTAMALSGAAPSPNMGYYTSPLVRLVFTLLNVRLGGWLGNPGPAGHKTFHLACPNFSVGPIIADTFGLMSDRHRYVNLSDARHFESLGLYEMVLRRCHYIVVCDAGRDPESLGGAVCKIGADLGIPIEFKEINIFPQSDDPAQNQEGRNCTIGRIRYSRVDGCDAPDGVIVYIKSACYGGGRKKSRLHSIEPRDVHEYFKTNPDQFVSESQFESYRWLGAYTIEELCANCEGDFRRFIRDILETHLKKRHQEASKRGIAQSALVLDFELVVVAPTAEALPEHVEVEVFFLRRVADERRDGVELQRSDLIADDGEELFAAHHRHSDGFSFFFFSHRDGH
jgi:hypothetical protein